MAGLNLEIPEDYLKDLLDHSFDDIAKKALEQTAPELEKSVKTCLRRSIKHSGDSELLKSIRKNRYPRSRWTLI